LRLLKYHKFQKSFGGQRPKTEKRLVTLGNGEQRLIKLRVNKPTKCSAVRRICIICKKQVIHKLDANYDNRVCKKCDGVK